MSGKFPDLMRSLQDSPDETPTSRMLAVLSTLTPAEQGRFREYWPNLSAETRRSSARTLVEMAEENVALDFTHIFRMILKDADEEVRLAALDGLWEDEDEALVPVLIRMMNADPSVLVRASTALVLGRFALLGELEEISAETTGALRRALMAVIDSPQEDLQVRRRAVEAVSFLSGEDVVQVIEEAYRDKDERMTVSAVFAMGHSLDERWAPFVYQELRNPRPEIRLEAARAAGALELQDAVPILLDVVQDQDLEVREAAIEALGNIGGDRAIQVLLELVQSQDETIRVAALEALEVAQFNETPLSPEVATWLAAQQLAEGGWDTDLGDEEDWDDLDDEESDEDDGNGLGE